MPIDWALLGKELRAAREHRGLSQEAFAKKLGLRQSDLSLLERGAKKRPGPEIIEKLRRDFGHLLGGPPARPVQSQGEVAAAMETRRLEEAREIMERLFNLTKKGNEVAQQHWTHLEHQMRTLLRDAQREG